MAKLEGQKKFSTYKEAYLDLLRSGKRKSTAARLLEFHPQTAFRAARTDPDFAKEVEDAIADFNETLVEDALNALHNLVLKENISAIKFTLTNRAGNEWSDKPTFVDAEDVVDKLAEYRKQMEELENG